ncbi:acyltransferase family protein [Pelagibacterium sp.]|uniref:acyltransferase family protein n=1 Tax=Pelagibacterium sp. TaxID=1967288 RepID=UPI003A8E05C3
MNDNGRAPQPPITRIGGIDAVRGLAVIGMLMVHVGPRNRDNLAEILYNFPHGRASILFIFVAGIGVSLLSARPGSRPSARLRLSWTVLVFLPLGLTLQALDHGVAVILHHYALFYCLGFLAMALPLRGLGLLAVVTTIVGPLVYFAIRAQWPDFVGREAVTLGGRPFAVIEGLLLTGPYPLLTWAPALLWGMWVGRFDLRSRHFQIRLALAGAAVGLCAAAISAVMFLVFGGPEGSDDLRHLLSDAPHGQMPLWIVGAVGTASAATGVMLILVDRWPRTWWPLVALGQLAFSFYIAHLIALHFFSDVLRHESVGPASVSVVLVGTIAMGFALVWRRHFSRGPLEALLVAPFNLATRLIR